MKPIIPLSLARRPLSHAVARATGFVDHTLFSAMRASHPRAPRDSTEALQTLAEIAEAYPTDPAGFYRSPRPIDPIQKRIGGLAQHGSLVDLRWRSVYTTWRPETAPAIARNPRNQWARVRLFTHSTPRPVVILVHGYATGHWRVERRVWPIDALYAAGLDVAIFVLPEHAARKAPGRRGPPPFPSGDPRLTNECFRRAVHELVDLIAWFEERGHGPVGVMGMSLGAYTAALLATVSDRLGALALVVPLASLSDYARDHGVLRDEALHTPLTRAHACVDPLRRPPQISGAKVRIAGARGDRVTPLHHAQRLATHFDAALDVWPGGHLVQLGRRRGFATLQRFMIRALS